MNSATNEFSSWIGRTETTADDLSPSTAQAAAAMFDQDPRRFTAGVNLPPLWHWFYFLTKAAQSCLGEDGHPRRIEGSFMPPVPLPRRMFAGARSTFHRPLRLGQLARREATIKSIVQKTGRSGALAFVTVEYRYFQVQSNGAPVGNDGELLCLEEQQEIVFREPGRPLSAPQQVELPTVPAIAWTRSVVPDSRLLFRFSALTFNAHRIHYDRRYAMDDEGYPGLVVHGPLTAMLLLQLVEQHTQQTIGAFRFRGQSPLFDRLPFRLVGVPSQTQVELEAQGPDARSAMVATANF